MAVYICGKCLFLFERTGEVQACPDCGRLNIRYASDEDASEYLKNRAELNDKGSKAES